MSFAMDLRETVTKLTEACMELRTRLIQKCDVKDRAAMVLNHLRTFAQTGVRVTDFQAGLEWINVTERLSLNGHLAKKVIILDFFTYCCINCMHVLPDLFELERKFPVEDGLVVIGVHSAKFSNERDSSRLVSAVERYGIRHPVANDHSLTCWRALGIVCWPTLLMIGPEGQPLAVFVGEGHKEELFLYTELALEYFKSLNSISKHSLPLSTAGHSMIRESERLRFPGKLTISSCLSAGTAEVLLLSDSGNNRVLLIETNGVVKHVIGGSEAGFKDGNFMSARLSQPQGTCTLANRIYVADTENHAIRMIDLDKQTVVTVAGTGSQGHDYIGGKVGKSQVISSPWDVCIYHHQESMGRMIPVLLIAMAGTHQIWALFLQDTIWWKNKKCEAGTCLAIVGSGKEENRNNAYPHAAGLAQPSGLVVDQEGRNLFFADSESSTIRRVDLQSGRVSALCGANKNPMDLHDYGDIDGTGNAAKLQHPLGLTWNSVGKFLYIADTYNHKIKRVHLNGSCEMFCGSGKPDRLFVFDEPSGLAVNRNATLLYIADTNNHAVKVIDLSNNSILTLPIEFPAEKEDDSTLAASQFDQTYQFGTTLDANGGKLILMLDVLFESEVKLSKEAGQKWRILPLPVSSGWKLEATAGELSTPISLLVSPGCGTKQLRIILNVVACTTTTCIPKSLFLTYKVEQQFGAPSTVVEQRQLVVKE